MINRIIEVAETPARLRVDLGRLAVDVVGQSTVFVPMKEIAAIVVSNPAVSLTQAVLSELAGQGGVFVAMSEQFLPVAMMLPLETHGTQTARMGKQAEASEPTKKRAWQTIVRAKVRAQWALLAALGRPEPGLEVLIKAVQSGDIKNIEAQAAARYWKVLFGPAFRRDRDAF